MAVTHSKVSAKSDGGDATLVLPTDWNAAHVVAITHAETSGKTANDHHSQSHDHSEGPVGTDIVPTTVRVTSVGDVGLATTTHGLQVGPSSGANLAADDNEIMARNNGAAATLAINADGGDVTVNTSGNAGALALGTATKLKLGHTSFPGSPSTDDVFYRKDLGMWFFYNGTRWLTTQLFRADFVPAINHYNLAATQADAHQLPVPFDHGGSDIWMEDIVYVVWVSGGSALSGSIKWVGTTAKRDAAGGNTTIATATIDSGSINAFQERTVVVDALLGSTYYNFMTTWTKTGGVGNLLYSPHYLTYRIVAT